MKPPMCKLCQKAHWLDADHDTSALGEVRALGASVLRKPAINDKERLTDAINTPAPVVASENRPRVSQVSVPVDSRAELPSAIHEPPKERGTLARTPNRRSRESYNEYMKGYMRAYRERK